MKRNYKTINLNMKIKHLNINSLRNCYNVSRVLLKLNFMLGFYKFL